MPPVAPPLHESQNFFRLFCTGIPKPYVSPKAAYDSAIAMENLTEENLIKNCAPRKYWMWTLLKISKGYIEYTSAKEYYFLVHDTKIYKHAVINQNLFLNTKQVQETNAPEEAYYIGLFFKNKVWKKYKMAIESTNFITICLNHSKVEECRIPIWAL